MSRARRLASIRRTIAPERREAYLLAWGEVQRLTTARGAHAWRFDDATRLERSIEFLEFPPGGDPRDDAAVAAALRALDDLAPGEAEEWVGG